jgi:hypothetical protein
MDRSPDPIQKEDGQSKQPSPKQKSVVEPKPLQVPQHIRDMISAQPPRACLSIRTAPKQPCLSVATPPRPCLSVATESPPQPCLSIPTSPKQPCLSVATPRRPCLSVATDSPPQPCLSIPSSPKQPCLSVATPPRPCLSVANQAPPQPCLSIPTPDAPAGKPEPTAADEAVEKEALQRLEEQRDQIRQRITRNTKLSMDILSRLKNRKK